MEQPPVIQAEPEAKPKTGLGRIGLCCSLAALGAFAVMWLCKPGWGSPITALGGLTLFTAAPLGFVLSLLGVLRNRDRKLAVIGLIISGAMVALFFLTALCWTCPAR